MDPPLMALNITWSEQIMFLDYWLGLAIEMSLI